MNLINTSVEFISERSEIFIVDKGKNDVYCTTSNYGVMPKKRDQYCENPSYYQIT